MNNFHRYLNLPFEIKKPDVFNTTPDHVVHEQIKVNDDQNMVNFLKQFGMDLMLVESFYTPPNGGKVPIHTDFWWYETDYVKINITWGPDDGKIIWWKCSKTQEVKMEPKEYDGLTYTDTIRVLTANESDCKEIFSANTNKVSLVNTGILHSTINPSNQPRWTLCFVPAFDIEKNVYVTWNEAMDIFKDYLEDS